MWGAPYGDAAANRRSAAPVASECVAGVPSLMVRAGGGLGRGVPACLVVASSPRRGVKRQRRHCLARCRTREF